MSHMHCPSLQNKSLHAHKKVASSELLGTQSRGQACTWLIRSAHPDSNDVHALALALGALQQNIAAVLQEIADDCSCTGRSICICIPTLQLSGPVLECSCHFFHKHCWDSPAAACLGISSIQMLHI